MLVGFPKNRSSKESNGGGPGPGKAKQRNSISLNPTALQALAGLDVSDYDDSDDEKAPKKSPPAPVPDRNPNPKASGGPEHRPLVGGFAAAAYEAARVDHYKKQGKDVRGHATPQKSRSIFPRRA